ncbi:MAG: iron-containing alcohol dehydrogenase [bacterium]
MMDRVGRIKMPGTLLMGIGAVSELAKSVESLGGRRVLVVADPGIVQAGVVDKVNAVLEAKQIAVSVYDGVESDPRLEIVSDCAERARQAGADVLIGVGGGSSLDIAKVAAIVVRHGGPVQRFFGIGNTPGRGLPTIVLPTTAGTGSEVTPIAVLSDEAEKLKKGIVSDDLYPDISIVDPGLMVSAPPSVTAYTGMDTLTHAIEAYTSRYSLPFVDTLALEAIRLVGRHLRRAVSNGSDLEARSGMALASTYGGMCLGPVNTAAVHALAYPLGGTYHVAHGQANALLLPYVMEFNFPSDMCKFAEVAKALGEKIEGLSLRDAALASVKAVRELSIDINLPQKMREFSIPEDAIPEMAEAAMKVTRLLNNDPRTVRTDDVRRIYEQAH